MSVPSVTASASVNPKRKYLDDNNAVPDGLTNTPVQIFEGRGNLYGFCVDENGGGDVFIQLFDAASTGDVTLGTTPPTLTLRVPASGKFGKDCNDTPFAFFSKGLVVACTAGRADAAAPSATPTSLFWFVNMKTFG